MAEAIEIENAQLVKSHRFVEKAIWGWIVSWKLHKVATNGTSTYVRPKKFHNKIPWQKGNYSFWETFKKYTWHLRHLFWLSQVTPMLNSLYMEEHFYTLLTLTGKLVHRSLQQLISTQHQIYLFILWFRVLATTDSRIFTNNIKAMTWPYNLTNPGLVFICWHKEK